ncbi:MAG: lytic transglycosylase domain-containing protein [Verrucomicrobia bacterium]|nr:lytic transglycosylase domain-containing protein [Verrucomicrobiota bacterium]
MLLARPRILAALAVILTPFLLIALSWLGEIRRSQAVGPLLAEAAANHGLPLPLLKAVVWRESDFETRALGAAGERGLMQVTPGAAEDWARAHRIRSFRETDLFDPRTNLAVGTWYLARAIRRWREEGADHPEGPPLGFPNPWHESPRVPCGCRFSHHQGLHPLHPAPRRALRHGTRPRPRRMGWPPPRPPEGKLDPETKRIPLT